MTGPITRFAPSPTGFLHVGGARTALFCWLYARHHGGRFHVRVEDTDRERNRPDLVQPILDGLGRLGLVADPFDAAGEAVLDGLPAGHPWIGRVVLQSKRLAAHREAAERLVAFGHAYACACRGADESQPRPERAGEDRTRAKLDHPCRSGGLALREGETSVRMKTPVTGEIGFSDAVKGGLRFACAELEDFVVLRSDGTPTYNLAAVVDDAWMGVTHVIRGDDHVINTPKQILVYRGLGLPVPVFAHVPMILGSDKTRLSKRHGATSVGTFLDEAGYLPDALRNYLVRLGWSHGDQEVFTLDEMTRLFDLDGVGTAAAVFDAEKLAWLSGVYVRERDPERLAHEWAAFLAHPERGAARRDLVVDARLVRLVRALRERARTLGELTEKAGFWLAADEALALPPPDDKNVRKWLDPDGLAALEAVVERLDAVEPFETEAIHAALTALAEERYAGKLGRVAQPLRLAVTGSTASPPIDETLALVGRAGVRARIERALAYYRAA